MPHLPTVVCNTNFKDEFAHITDYIVNAFYGETEDTIRTQMDAIFDLMVSDIRDNQYVMISDSAASDERCDLGEYLRSIKDEVKTKRLISYAEIVCFNPDDSDELNTLDQNKLWRKTRKQVANIFRKNMPNLKPKGLFELLENEDAVIKEQPSFNGITIETIGAYPFHKRVTPRNLRYDQQEQGNSWSKVVAGAIVCHYHTFIEIKQNEHFRLALLELTGRVKSQNWAPELDDIQQWMVNTYKQASLISQ
jgi:hypothetical protein